MLLRYFFLILITSIVMTSSSYGGDKIVIAEQGPTTPLIGDTLSALVLAASTDADYIEQHLVMTKDDQLVVFNDLYLGEKTNVATLFPMRNREDGKYYVIDFTLAEVQQLSLDKPGINGAILLRIPSFQDALITIETLEKPLGKKIGIYLEIKHPWFHMKEGKDISNITLKMLKEFGYSGTDNAIFIQCYDSEELQRIHKLLMPAMGMDLKLVQRINVNDGIKTQHQKHNVWKEYDHDWMFTQFGLKVIGAYADALGLNKTQLIDEKGNILLSDFVTAVHSLGIQIHVLNIEQNAQKEVSSNNDSYEELLESIFFQAQAEAIVTNDWSSTAIFLKKKLNTMANTSEKLNTKMEGQAPLNNVDLEFTSSPEPRETTTKL